MSMRRILSFILIALLILTTACAYADNKYSYIYSNAAGKVYYVETEDGWFYEYFEGNGRMFCKKYDGEHTQIVLPTDVDGHAVFISNMTLPFGQIERIDVPEYFDNITEDVIGNVFCLKQGCLIAIHNANAHITLPAGACEDMSFSFAGHAGSTTEEFANSHGFPFELLDGGSPSETPYISIDAGYDKGLIAGAAGGRGMDINIDSNTQWNIQIVQGQDWIHISCDSGTGKGTFYTMIDANETANSREGRI